MSRDPGILSSCRFVAEHSVDVQIDEEAIIRLAESVKEREPNAPPWNRELHYYDGTEKTLYYVLVLDTLNFCFWSNPGEPRWQVVFNGQVHDGYCALAASLKKAWRDDACPLWDSGALKALRREDLASILKGCTDVEIPLLEERLNNLRETGVSLRLRWEGRFERMVEAAGHDALALACSLADSFSSFRDEAEYRGKRVYFYKRAQILVSDLAGTFSHEGTCRFDNLSELTAFADYKVPQVLRGLEILRYSRKLADIVDNRRFLEAGSPPEVEIRAATVWAVELLRQKLSEGGKPWTAVDLDWLLWEWGQQKTPATKPYHLTRTIYY